ncbi:hypothetical protein TNCT_524371 [Trichonephila clavata]|uniref:CCHC-type domain-containing protein n=1 Tax=Trichonephila clavata TaxID=2740835 RepID=A0A8X6K2A6_TRICU|nr:hypothetical protein TNCT_524371 [Trichonephila clavata]
MAYLGKAKQKDLFLVAAELGETASEDMKVIELKQIILGGKNYEDEFVKNLLESIMSERIENENLEIQTLAREIQLEKEAREREFQILQQNKEIEKQQLELECLRAKQNTVVTKSGTHLKNHNDARNSGKAPELNFDNRKRLQCYECGSFNHLRPQCPSFKTQKADLCRIGVKSEGSLLDPYTLEGRVTGVECLF